MNEHFRPDRLPTTTQAAEGLPRRRWTVAELEAAVAEGIISEDERFELIGGEAVPMCPKGRRHEILSGELAFYMTQRATADLRLKAEAQLNLTDDSYLLPDILVYPAAIKVPDVRGPTALLVIEIADNSLVEVADTSLRYDLQTKAPAYARLGLREYWVVDATNLITFVHHHPRPDGYPDPRKVGPSELLEPLLAPQLAVRLTELGLTPAT